MMMIKRMWPKISSHPYSRLSLCWLEIIDKKKINLKSMKRQEGNDDVQNKKGKNKSSTTKDIIQEKN
jgi:hypothetical protein